MEERGRMGEEMRGEREVGGEEGWEENIRKSWRRRVDAI